MNNKLKIEHFLRAGKIAIVGVSRNSKKFSNMVLRDLLLKGYAMHPVNQYVDQLEGVKCYQNLNELPADVNHLLIITPKSATTEIMKAVVGSKIKQVWIQQMSDTPEALEIARDNDIELIHGKCIFMFSDPVKGLHAFHRFLAGMFSDIHN
ncbi:MAG: CoA-binding protein [Bacteroidales bacterium]|nr:CoA-binding protein [Bacteroidales bacterium]